MPEKRIKILGVAPYDGMKNMMQRLASERKDIDLTVFVGDLTEGVEIAKKHIHSNYDVIISRGGTAEMISQITNIPLVEITLSVYDIIRAIKLAEHYSDRYAIVGYPGITGSAQLLCDLLQYEIDIVTIHHQDEVEQTLKNLKKQGYQMVLCDMITKTTAKHLGLNAILITSGDESIITAFDQAEKLYRSYVSIKEDNRFLEDIIKTSDTNILVFDQELNLIINSGVIEHIDELTLALKKEMLTAKANETKKFVKIIDDVLFNIVRKHVVNRNIQYSVFYIKTEHAPLSHSKYGIKYSNRLEVEDSFFNSFYSVSNPMQEERENLQLISSSSAPVLIIGERGSGKSQISRLIYTQSSVANKPLISIDCEVMSEKTWTYLINHINSPLTDTDNTLFFKDVHALANQKLKQLLSYILDMNIHKRNRIIISYAVDQIDMFPEDLALITNQLNTMKITLSPLRDKVNDIPKLSSLYLSTLNLSLSKQIIGFDQEALSLLQNYRWPGNYAQFKRVLNEMTLVTTTPYISSNTVRHILGKEKISNAQNQTNFEVSKNCIPYELNMTMTLESINKEIINIFIEKAKGNHSQAAKKLGISRTTLWRYLKS